VQYIFLVGDPSSANAYPPVRGRKITEEIKAQLRGQGDHKSLRQLAKEFGLSHETVRTALRSQ